MDSVDRLFRFYEEYGNSDYIGEEVTQTQHMVQAAATAKKMGMDDEFVLAALFHDIGHLIEINNNDKSMDGYGVIDHEKIGANYLRKVGFSERLCRLVELHVIVKRYLVSKYPDYAKKLSFASRTTLGYQGGPMDKDEMDEFEKDPLFEEAIKMRQCDEAGKDIKIDDNDEIINVEEYKIMARNVLEMCLKCA